MAHNRRSALFSIATAMMAASCRSAYAGFVLDIYDEPRTIVEAILDAYVRGKPADLMKLPFVPRIRVALARTDIDTDPVINAADFKLGGVMVSPTRMNDTMRASVEASFRDFGKQKSAIFDFDRTSGDWLITDIRHPGGASLRRLLQIPNPR